MSKFVWRKDQRKDVDGWYGGVRSRGWRLFEIQDENFLLSGTEKRWKLTCRLPGVAGEWGVYSELEEAKEKAKDILRFWFDQTGVVWKDGSN